MATRMIRLLGRPRADAAEARGNKPRAIAAYLALAGGPVSRGRLIALLFEDAADPAGSGPPSAAAGAQAQAAAWIAGQVSGNAIVACYPGMCAALQEQGVAAGRLMQLRSAAVSPRGAGVLVTPRRPTARWPSGMRPRRVLSGCAARHNTAGAHIPGRPGTSRTG